MKNTIICSLLAFGSFMSTGKAQDLYQIEGSVIPSPKDQTMHLYYYKHGTRALEHDSCKVVNGKFSFSGPANKLTLGFLTVPPEGTTLNTYLAEHGELPKNQLGIYLEKGDIQVVLRDQKLQEAQVTGTPENDAANVARPMIWKYKNKEEALSKKLIAAGADADARNVVIQEYNQMVKERTVDVGKYIQKYPEALAALDLLKRWVDPTEDLTSAKTFYGYLAPALKTQTSARMYASRIQQIGNVSEGSVAPDFTLADTAGNQHQLHDFQGKYVLVDFWASWCVPCRQENPNLIKAYEKYKSKNFEIIGVSLDGGRDDSHQRWVDAIKKDQLSWLQLSDLKNWGSPVAKTYQVTAIPMNFLIGPDGKIVARNLRGEELMKFLEKTL